MKQKAVVAYIPEQVIVCTAASAEERHARLMLVKLGRVYQKSDGLF
jgi:hypothetical protein